VTQTLTMSPPIPIEVGDMIAIRNLTICGAPTGLSSSSASAEVAHGSSFPTFYPCRSDCPTPVQVALLGTGAVNSSVIPVVISSAGEHSSFFRTSLQLSTSADSLTPAMGRLIFRGEAVPRMFFTPLSFPSLSYSLAPGSVLSIPDLLGSFGVSGLGSVDVISDSGPPPVGIARIYNDLGAAGTSGFTEEALSEATALKQGDVALLFAPSDPVNFRFNIGIRSITTTELTATLRDASGAVRGSVDVSFPASYMFQTTASSFFQGLEVGANDTVTITVR